MTDKPVKKTEKEEEPKPSPISGLTNDDQGSPMRQSTTREKAAEVLRERAKEKGTER